MARTVSFTLTGTPKNWLNVSVWSRRAAIAVSEEKRDWKEAAILWGRAARIKAGIEIAQKGDHRTIHITEYRRKFLDHDGLQASAKPIVDGLKTILRKKGSDGKMHDTPGAGLLYDDDPIHATWKVTQEKVEKGTEPRTIIIVGIE